MILNDIIDQTSSDPARKDLRCNLRVSSSFACVVDTEHRIYILYTIYYTYIHKASS